LNREIQTRSAGRLILACLLGMLLAMAAPLAMLAEILTLSTVLLLPSIALIWLYRWGGKGPAMLSAVLQMAFTAMMMGTPFMWMAFFTTIFPVFMLASLDKKPFFEQLKISLGAFGAGIVISVVILYFSFGGNMIERFFLRLPEVMRAMPLEMISGPMQNFSEMLGRELTPESFFQVFEEAIVGLIPSYQLSLPGQIFSGGLLSTVICVWISNYMLNRCGASAEGCYRPLKDWALPASTTGGLLLITVVSYIIYAAGMKNGKALYFTVYNISITAFCIQTVGSIARKVSQPQLAARSRTGIVAGTILLCLLGGTLYIAIYGCASAVFGTYGALNPKNKKTSGKDIEE